MKLQQMETIYKCQRPPHEDHSAKYLCIKPECQESLICCELCINDYHKNHLPSMLVPIVQLNQISQLSLNTAYAQITIFEQNLKYNITKLKEELYKFDFSLQLQTKPSARLLKQMGYLAKHQANYLKINSIVKNNFNEINRILSDTLKQIKITEDSNI